MKAIVYNKIRNCSKVGMHGWYESSVGVIRKPNGVTKYKKPESKFVVEKYKKPSFLLRIWYWLKSLWK